MLLDADLPNKFWAEAVNTANNSQNRLPSRAIEGTPYEAWNRHFSYFGAKCFVHIPSEKRRKLDDTAATMIFVRYDENSKGFRCSDPARNKLVISRDVRFTECSANEISVDLSSGNANVESSIINVDVSEPTEMAENANVRHDGNDAEGNSSHLLKVWSKCFGTTEAMGTFRPVRHRCAASHSVEIRVCHHDD